MTFHSIVRQWCRIYRPMQDGPKNRRFYLTDSTAGVVELAKHIATSLSPCVVMESSVEGSGPIERIDRNYPVYFFVKADKMSDGDDAAVAKEEAFMHAQKFLAWLKYKHDKDIENNRIDGDFGRIELDKIIIDVTTVGPIENGWFAVLLQFERTEPLDLCIDWDLYVTDDSDDDSSDSHC